MRRRVGCDALCGDVEVKEQRALTVIADHALNPEKRRSAGPPCNWAYVMQACRGVENHVSCGQLYGMDAISIFDDEFTAVILVGVGEEERCRKVCANTMSRAGDLTNGIIDMRTERLSSGI